MKDKAEIITKSIDKIWQNYKLIKYVKHVFTAIAIIGEISADVSAFLF